MAERRASFQIQVRKERVPCKEILQTDLPLSIGMASTDGRHADSSGHSPLRNCGDYMFSSIEYTI